MSELKTIAKQIAEHLPRGVLWDSLYETSSEVFCGMAAEFSRIKQRGRDLIVEGDPGTSSELLEDWEATLGLPDECTVEGADEIERRRQARQKLAAVGGFSAAYIESIVAAFGYQATVSEYFSFRAGMSVAGDGITNSNFDPAFSAGDPVGSVLQVEGWQKVFNVNLDADAAQVFTAGSTAGESLVAFENALVECTIVKLKPADTLVIFSYT